MVATVQSSTEFEDFTGTTNAISGWIKFDPSKKTGSGKLVIDAKTIKTGIDLRDDHMNGEMWLNTAKFPTIEFETTSVKSSGGSNYTVTGNLTMRGVTKKVTTKATVSYLAGTTATAQKGFKGDIVRVKTSLKVNLSDFGISIPAPAKGKVSNSVTIGITAFGTTG